MTFGEKVKNLRETRGYSQEELAHLVGFETRGAISKLERGVVDPPRTMLVKLAKALNVSPIIFFEGFEKDFSKSPMMEFVPYLEKASGEELAVIRKILDMPKEKKAHCECSSTAS